MTHSIDDIHPMTAPLIAGDFYCLEQQEPLFVRIGTPAKDPLPGGDMYCPIEVRMSKHGDLVFETTVFGINSLQAVELAFQCLRQRWPLIVTDSGASGEP